MSESELGRFERLLDQPDPDLYAWIIGAAPIPTAFDDDLMKQLRDFRPCL